MADPLSPLAMRHPLPPSLRRLCQWLRGGVLLGLLALCVVPVVFWLTPAWVAQAGPEMANLGAGARITLDGRALALGALGSLPSVGAGLWTLWRLWQLFAEYSAGRVFSALALLALRGFARALLVLAALAPVQRTALGLALTLGNPPGERLLVVGLGLGDYLGLMVGATLLLITSVMSAAVAEAQRLADENNSFI